MVMNDDIRMNEMVNGYPLHLGKISKFVDVIDSVIRYIHDEDEEFSGFSVEGHLTNISEETLSLLIIDVSYYDEHEHFLGTNTSTLVNEHGLLSELKMLESGDTIPFACDLNIPETTVRCTLNIIAKPKRGLLHTLSKRFFK